MKLNPQVSIIINNYNYGQYLAVAIDSALDQTVAAAEIIVIDDGSTDSSMDVIASFGERIIPVCKKNGGQASCFNEGFRICKGELIIFLDADDFLADTAIEKAIESFSNPEIVKVHWQMQKVDENGNLTRGTLPDDKLSEGDLKQQVIKFGPTRCGGPPHSPPTSGNAWSRNFLDHVLPMPESPFKQGADNYLFVLAPVYGMIISIEQPLSYYRVHGSNNTLKPDYMTKYFDRFEHCCDALRHHLEMQGIVIPSSGWPRDHWYHRLYDDMQLLAQFIPAHESFILVDENLWMSDELILGRQRILFTEKNGQYWGPPVDDEAAVTELEEDRKKGAGYIVFTWPAFWWLDHYTGFRKYLESLYGCIMQNERMKIYYIKNRITTT